MADDINAVAAHCPSYGADYRAGFDTCADSPAFQDVLIPEKRLEEARAIAKEFMPS